MNCNEVCIDFSKAKNKICLLIGHNGSGKTTLLSLMHPFADIGNLDVRNGNSLIEKEKEGYKEIVIEKGEDVYTIKHFYFPHKEKNHSVKSYIEKNGTELNPNGNVTSFKDLVKLELFIEPDYLKLIRLGNNVTSMIDLTATERKNFMGKILDDIGIWLDYYKAVNTKIRQLDEMISHTVDKLNRLGVLDKKEYQDNINSLEEELMDLQNEYMEENNRLGLLKNIFDGIEDKENLQSNLSLISKKYQKMLGIMERKNQIESFDPEFYGKKLLALEREIASYENESKTNLLMIQNTMEQLNTYEEQRRTLEVQSRKEKESEEELKRMEENLNRLRLKLREYEDSIGEFVSPFTKEEFNQFISFLNGVQQVLRRTYEFGGAPIKRVVELMKGKKNVMNYINSHILDLNDETSDQGSLFMATIANRFMLGKEDMEIECREECPAKRLFYQIQALLKDSNVNDKNESAMFYQEMEQIHANLIRILPQFVERKEFIDRLPEDIKKDFTPETLYKHIEKMELIYNEKKLNAYQSQVVEYDAYLSALQDYSQAEEIYKKFSVLAGNGQIQGQLQVIESLIQDCKDKIYTWKEENLSIKESLDECLKSQEALTDVKETIERFDEVKQLYQQYTESYELYQTTMASIREAEIGVIRLKSNIDSLAEDIQKKKITLSQYQSLRKELKRFQTTYDEMVIVKNALSSKEGIPLRKMGNYLRNTEELTNELLDIVYGGSIFIDKFYITPTEFSIPFYNKGKRLDDVKFASQGELSFLSIALSFSLAGQKLKKYNIMLLDEVDGVLDIKNREKFIRILEAQIERIQSEQVFIITHNDMFSSYPVDILDLEGEPERGNQYPIANLISIVKS